MAPRSAAADLTTLCRWEHSYVDDIAPWLRADAEWKQWDAPYFPGPTPQEATATLADLRRDPDQREPHSGVVRRRAIVVGGTAVGMVSWAWEDRPAGHRGCGIVVYDPTLWSGGVGTAAFGGWAGWLAELPDTKRLDLTTWSGNMQMLRLGRRCGFTEETRRTDAREVRSRSWDAVVLTMPQPGGDFAR